jgi:sialic acid synthase SpsE
MAKVKVCLDPGSCHMGKLGYALELIELAIKSGADYCKFQMGVSYPNIDISKEWWPILKEKAGDKIGLTASTFDKESYDFMLSQNPPFMKFAYSSKDKLKEILECLDREILTVVSCDMMTEVLVPDRCLKLYCIPEYPVKYQIDFDGIFPTFYGFSDHTLRDSQTKRAIKYGAKWIEKHFTLDKNDITCPDHAFALKPNYLMNMMGDI